LLEGVRAQTGGVKEKKRKRMEREKMGKGKNNNNGKGSGKRMKKCKMLTRNHHTAIFGCGLDQTQPGRGRNQDN
jgi:hypothetical protein